MPSVSILEVSESGVGEMNHAGMGSYSVSSFDILFTKEFHINSPTFRCFKILLNFSVFWHLLKSFAQKYNTTSI